MPTTPDTYRATSPWAAHEMRTASFGDQRLMKRAALMLTQMLEHPEASILETCGSVATAKAAYQFFANAGVTPTTILAPHRDATIERCGRHRIVVIAQDTTEVTFNGLQQTVGLGRLRHNSSHGLLVHTLLAMTVETELLGILGQKQWTREPKSPETTPSSSRPIAEKESIRWLDGVVEVAAALPKQTQAIVVADREADIFELFAQQRPVNLDIVIRVAQNRRVLGPLKTTATALEQAPELGCLVVSVSRGNARQPRRARCVITVIEVEICPPHYQAGSSVRLRFVRIREIDPPEKTKGIDWILATTLAVEDLATAERVIGYYSQRWVIERFHYTLKSGCRIEQLQLEEYQRLSNAIACYSIIAWRLLQMTYVARANPEAPCTEILTSEQWHILYQYHHRSLSLPTTIPSTKQAITWIAQLGGYLARNADPPPGVKVLWRGLRTFDDILEGWILARSLYASSP